LGWEAKLARYIFSLVVGLVCLFVVGWFGFFLLFQGNINANKKLAVAENSQSTYAIKPEISQCL